MNKLSKTKKNRRFVCPVHSIFCFSFFGQSDQKQKNQLSFLFIFLYKKSAFCLKMTADFFGVLVKVTKKTKKERWNEPDSSF